MAARLRANPADRAALVALLDYVEQKAKTYYVPGELYSVPTNDGLVTKELAKIGELCCVDCLARGCPGQLLFRDGTQICPFMWRTVKAITTDQFRLPMQLVQRLLYRGHKRGSVELFDGRTISFNIRDAKR